MYKVAIITHFSAAHEIKGYKGKCSNLHGHNWKIKVEVLANKTNEIGICIDFKELKAITNKVIEKFDHKYLNDLDSFKDNNPTAENISRYLYTKIKTILPEGIKMDSVTTWETDKYSINYSE